MGVGVKGGLSFGGGTMAQTYHQLQYDERCQIHADILGDGGEGAVQELGVAQHERFQMPCQGMQAVLEVGLWQRLVGTLLGGRTQGGIAIGEGAGHRDQVEVRPQLLEHEAFTATVKLLDFEELLADLESLFHSPSGVMQVGEGGDGVAAGIEQGGAEQVGGGGMGVLLTSPRDRGWKTVSGWRAASLRRVPGPGSMVTRVSVSGEARKAAMGVPLLDCRRNTAGSWRAW